MKIRIDRIAPEGEGIGKVPGSDKIAFVPYGLPGDVVEAAAVEEKSRFIRARVESILERSPLRVDPRCPIHFTPGATRYCGGCDWQHAAYEAQLKLKRDMILECLQRIGKLEAPVLGTIPSPQPWRYRNKVQVPFQPAVPGTSPRRPFLAGFYLPGSHRVIEFEDCAVQPELSVGIVRTVKELAAAYGWSVYDEQRGRGWLRHLYLRTNSKGEAAVVFVTRERPFPREREVVAELVRRHPKIVSVWQNLQEEKTSVILGPRWRKLAGADRLTEAIGPLNLEFSPGAFVQVNTPAAEALYRTVEQLLLESNFKPALALDIYCGVGAIALWIARGAGRGDAPSTAGEVGHLARGAGRVIGIEESPQAVEDAYLNARRLGMRHVSFVQGRAEFALRRLRGLGAARPWAAVVDPPRSGCEAGVLRFLASHRVERIIYVSCNPATFARDARVLADAGYRLEKVQPVDLFPQTSHVELAAKFCPVNS